LATNGATILRKRKANEKGDDPFLKERHVKGA